MRAIYIGGTLAVGLLTGAVFAALSAAGWDDTMPRPLPAFIIGFMVGTASTVVSGALGGDAVDARRVQHCCASRPHAHRRGRADRG